MYRRNIVTWLTLTFSLGTIAVPATAQKIYWNGNQIIHRANIDGTDIEDLIDLRPYYADQIALDQSRGKIYWTEYEPMLIRRANLDGTNVETVLSGYNASAIAIDEINGRIYWSDGFDFGIRVRRSDRDGNNIQDILDTGNHIAVAIDLDVAGGKIYLIIGYCYLIRANLDGSQAEVIHVCQESYGFDVALDPVNRKLYWTEGSPIPAAGFGVSAGITSLLPSSHRLDITRPRSAEVAENQRQEDVVGVGSAPDAEKQQMFAERHFQRAESTQSGFHSFLFRANLDGTGVEILPFPTADPIAARGESRSMAVA